ncbi:MAG: Lipocalin-like domain [Bacteroidota bacterium]
MRGTIVLLFAVLMTLGCATKEEQARTDILGTWRIEFVFENGQDITAAYTNTRVNYRISFDNNGGFEENYQVFAGGDNVTLLGAWDFSDKATKITLNGGGQVRVYQVDKLDEDEFNVTDLSSNNERQIEFVPN